MAKFEQTPTHMLAVAENAVWLQANMRFGNMVEGLSEDWLGNRARAAEIIGRYTTADQVVRMKPEGESGFTDLDKQPVDNIVRTDGFITSNPNLILHANPADCGEIALYGFGTMVERPVAALFHANRKIVSQGGHLQAIEYLCESRGIAPGGLGGFISPSVRADSYRMKYLGEDFQNLGAWESYIKQGDDGLWRVDLHGRVMAELEQFGIPHGNLQVSDIDTAVHPDYFSHTNYQAGTKPPGANGLMYALR